MQTLIHIHTGTGKHDKTILIRCKEIWAITCSGELSFRHVYEIGGGILRAAVDSA